MRVEDRDAYVAAQGARQAWRTLTWQVPALALTAEAVLITVIVDPDTGDEGRLIASVVALLAVTMALQLFLRHGYLQNLTEKWLGDVEAASGLPPISDRTAFAELQRKEEERKKEADKRSATDGLLAKLDRKLFSPLARVPSRPIWALVLSFLSVLDVLVVLDVVAEMAWGESVLR